MHIQQIFNLDFFDERQIFVLKIIVFLIVLNPLYRDFLNNCFYRSTFSIDERITILSVLLFVHGMRVGISWIRFFFTRELRGEEGVGEGWMCFALTIARQTSTARSLRTCNATPATRTSILVS